MSKEKLTTILENLLENNVVTREEFNSFINEINSSTADNLEIIRLKLVGFLERRLDDLDYEFLNDLTEYTRNLNTLAGMAKDDQELQNIVLEFNQRIEKASEEFSQQLEEVRKDYNEVILPLIEEIETEAKKSE